MAECDPSKNGADEYLGEGTCDDMKYCSLMATQTWDDVKISPGLQQYQQREMRDLLTEYSDVLTYIPGKSDLTE